MHFSFGFLCWLRSKIINAKDDYCGNTVTLGKDICDDHCGYSCSVIINGVEHEIIVRKMDTERKIVEMAEKIANG